MTPGVTSCSAGVGKERKGRGTFAEISIMTPGATHFSAGGGERRGSFAEMSIMRQGAISYHQLRVYKWC